MPVACVDTQVEREREKKILEVVADKKEQRQRRSTWVAERRRTDLFVALGKPGVQGPDGRYARQHMLAVLPRLMCAFS